MAEIKKHWYKEMAVYQVWPRSFKDGNGDGIGDLKGVMEKLDYIKSIGVDAIWFSPLYKSPQHDYGYDIADYKAIAPEYGTLEEFKELLDFVREARFERLGAFRYSEEEGTFGAENFKDSISAKVKQERLDALMELQSGISLAFNQSRVGTEVKVVVDDFVDGVFVCRSEFESPEVDGEILVKYDAAKMGPVDPYSLVGEFITVLITGADEYDLIAEPVEI